jgi:DNA-directed RNA polymerase subunit RPC12/RpoP
MKRITMYVCSVCKRDYFNESAAMECMDAHGIRKVDYIVCQKCGDAWNISMGGEEKAKRECYKHEEAHETDNLKAG